MSFEDLPPLPALLNPGADEYAERIVAASKAAMQGTRCLLDQPYGEDYWQKVDIYLPASSDRAKPWPVLCYFHGGAWSNGCKEWMGFMAPGLVQVPAIFVSISYRLAPAARMPAIVADCADAVAWIYRHVGAHGGDPHRLFLGGHSAGGHLAALLALRHDLLASRGVPNEALRGAFTTSGSYDLRPRQDAAATQQHLLHRVLEAPDAGWEWSPLRYAEGNRLPFLVTWGESDFPRLMEQGSAFVASLEQQPGRVERMVVPGTGHFTVNEHAAADGNAWLRTVAQWMADPAEET